MGSECHELELVAALPVSRRTVVLTRWLAWSANLWRYRRLIGVAARTRLKAVGIAAGVWFVLVIGVDMAAIAALTLLPPARPGWWLSMLLMADPVDSARALGLSLFQTDFVAGPMGAALREVLGGAGGLGPRGSTGRVDAGAAGFRRANLHKE